ncbi:uncharacterized protein RBU47_006976 [Passerculus sandwichensis]
MRDSPTPHRPSAGQRPQHGGALGGLQALHKGRPILRPEMGGEAGLIVTDRDNSQWESSAIGCGSGCAGSQTDVTVEIWKGLNLLLCILLGFAAGTLLYMPIIGFLLCRCRRNRTGELVSEDVTEGNQVSTAAPVTGTEDLTYANLKFEKKGIGSVSSNVIYTEIKPLQQKQSGGDGSAACTEVDVSPKEEGK